MIIKKEPKISIIVPVYNTEKFLKYCIQSVLQQQYRNLEVILVNDGSTDESGKICDELEEVDYRVKVIHQKNSGASIARNRGLDNVTGDYVMFLDSDDYWVDSCLIKIVEKISNSVNEIDVMFLKTAVITDDGKLTAFKGYEFEYFNRKDMLKYISTQDKIAVSACLKVINRKVFENKKMYFQEALLAEDIDWFFKLMNFANHFVAYEGEFYCYRILESSASRSTDEKRIKDYLNILKKWIAIANSNSFTEKREYLYMIGYEYEILLATFYNYDISIRKKYLKEIEDIKWILKYRNKLRSNLIKALILVVGFETTCRLLNFYLNKRKKR